jgi:hypothetical protein
LVYFITKLIITALLIVLISEIAKRSSLMSALLAAIPLVSILAMTWMYIDTNNSRSAVEFSNRIIWLIVPSMILFTTSSASLHDSQKLEELVNQHDNRLFADSAYRSDKIENYLWLKKCKSFVHEKAYRSRPLTHTQERSNSIKSKIRVKVEHVFGYMTNSMNKGLDLKAIGKDRIESSIGLLNLTYNLFRYEQLVRLQKVKMM